MKKVMGKLVICSQSGSIFTFLKNISGFFWHFSTLSQTTNFKLFETEGVADDNFKLDENGRKFSKPVKNTVFSKDLYCRHVKTRAYFGKGLETQPLLAKP